MRILRRFGPAALRRQRWPISAAFAATRYPEAADKQSGDHILGAAAVTSAAPDGVAALREPYNLLRDEPPEPLTTQARPVGLR